MAAIRSANGSKTKSETPEMLDLSQPKERISDVPEVSTLFSGLALGNFARPQALRFPEVPREERSG